jgi:hypothetical protein
MYLRGIQGANKHVDNESVCNESVITRQGPILLDQPDKFVVFSPFRAHLRTQVILFLLGFLRVVTSYSVTPAIPSLIVHTKHPLVCYASSS